MDNTEIQGAIETVIGFPLGALFAKLEITMDDVFNITGAGKLLVANITRGPGHEEIIRLIMNDTADEFTPFDPQSLNLDVRNELIHKLTKKHVTQETIAVIFNITPSMVGRVLRLS